VVGKSGIKTSSKPVMSTQLVPVNTMNTKPRHDEMLRFITTSAMEVAASVMSPPSMADQTTSSLVFTSALLRTWFLQEIPGCVTFATHEKVLGPQAWIVLKRPSVR
jgi:hypothetical protein